MSEPTYTFSGGMNYSVASEMMDANKRIKTELDTLHTDLQATLSAWQTPSSKIAYESRKTRWDGAAAAMPASLTAASQTLENITRRMQSTEDAITDSWTP